MDNDTERLYDKIINVGIDCTVVDEINERLKRGEQGEEEEDQYMCELLEDAYGAVVESKQLAQEKLGAEPQGEPQVPNDRVTDLWKNYNITTDESLAYEGLEAEDQGVSEIPMDQVTARWKEHENTLITYIGQKFEVSKDYSSLREQIETERVRTRIPIPRFMMKRHDSEVVE